MLNFYRPIFMACFGSHFENSRHLENLKTQNCSSNGSCNKLAPVTNLCLGRATMRSHSSQWNKKKVAVET